MPGASALPFLSTLYPQRFRFAPRGRSTGDRDTVPAAPAADARRFALGTRTLPDRVAPAAVEVTRDHLRVDRQLVRTLVVTDYPRTVGAGWLTPLVELDAAAELSLHLHPLDSAEIGGALSHRLAQLHSSRLLDARGGRLSDPERDVACEDLERLRDALQRGQERVFSVSLYLLLRAGSREALDDLTRRVEGTLAGMQVHSREALFEQDAGFASCLPLGQDRLRVYRNLDTSSVAAAFPFCLAGLSSERGVLYGVATRTSSPVVLDPFGPEAENANHVVFATSGAGKSYLTKLLTLRCLQQGVDVIVVDPEDEYRTLCAAVGGQHVRLGASATHRINPFDLAAEADPTATRSPAIGAADDTLHSAPDRLTPPAAEGGAEDGDGDPLAEQVAALVGLVEVALAGTAGSLDVYERGVLDAALYRTYAVAGITADAATHPQPAPLLRDLLATLEREPGDVAAGLASRLRRFVDGSLKGLFAGPTSVALDRPFTVFDVRRLEPELRPLAMHVIAAFVWGRVRRARKPRLLVVDEAWSLLQHPAGGAFLSNVARRARKHYLGLLTISQDVTDFLANDHGRAVVGNAAVKVLLKQDHTTIGPVVQSLHLSTEERRLLLAAGKGDALLCARGTRVPLRIEASPVEHRLATTAPWEVDGAGGDPSRDGDGQLSETPAGVAPTAGPRRSDPERAALPAGSAVASRNGSQTSRSVNGRVPPSGASGHNRASGG